MILSDLGSGLTVERLAISDIREQDTNAHVMPPAKFERLTENIRKRGALESVPYCVRLKDGHVEVVSGHHRIRAGRKAGLTEVVVLVDSSGLDRSSIAAKQIAHNVLNGYDDESVLKEIIRLIDKPDDLLETGLDEETLGKLEIDDVNLSAPHLDFDWKNVTFTFLPHQLEEFTDLLDTVEGRQDLLGAVPEDQFKSFMKATSEWARFKDVRSIGTVIALLTRVAAREVLEMQEAEAS